MHKPGINLHPPPLVKMQQHRKVQAPASGPHALAVPGRDGLGISDLITHKHKTMVSEYAWALILKRDRGLKEARRLTLVGQQPSLLKSVDKNNGETVVACMHDQSLPAQAEIVKNIGRQVDIHCHDE